MKKWILKAIVQKTISFLPFRYNINFLFQKYITRGVNLDDDYFEIKLTHARDHIFYFKKYSSPQNNYRCLELGTGWYPVVPIALFLDGANEVNSLDISSHLTKERLLTTIKKYKEWSDNTDDQHNLHSYLPNKDNKRWQNLMHILENEQDYSLEGICKEIKLKLLIQDARNISLEKESIDFICSNNTFEHIPPDILENILIEFKRIIKPYGVMSHFIDMSDHFAHFDKGITIYNFLKYPDQQWKLIDNSIQPQNRLRITDYRTMYSKIDIPISEENNRPGNIEEVKTIKLAQKFRKLSLKEIAVSHGYLVTKFQL